MGRGDFLPNLYTSFLMSVLTHYSTLIFDIGDVLFSWSPKTKTSISPKTLHKILSTPTWFDYECGRISQEVCYDRVGSQFSINPEEVEKAFDEARDSLQCDEEMISVIRELKSQSPGLRVFAMSNISIPDYRVLRTKPADWSIFDEVFTSGAAGDRKPNLGFFKQVIAKTNIDPSTAIFVDDKSENVLSARSLGFHGIIFDNAKNVARSLRNLVGDPAERGRQYLNKHARHHDSVTDGGIVIHENFAQLLILELIGDRSMVHLVEHRRTWNFFQGQPLLTTEEFPFDLDTTSLALSITKPDAATVHSVLDEMLQYLNSDGIIQTYFDHQRPRFDPVVCVNVLNLFHMYGRGSELHRTAEWIYEVLLNRAYLDGTRYYSTPECFLYFLGRLVSNSEDSEIQQLLRPVFKERLLERIGTEGDALALGMRVLTCLSMDILDEVDMHKLSLLQSEDGGWENGWVYKYGSSGVQIGNRGLTTAMAIKAIEGFRKRASQKREPYFSDFLNTTLPPAAQASSFDLEKRQSSAVGPLPHDLKLGGENGFDIRRAYSRSFILAVMVPFVFVASSLLFVLSPLQLPFSASL